MFIILGAAIGVLIWLLIFAYGLIFRPRRLPYLIYLILSFIGLHVLWRLYFVHDQLLITILISLSILLSTFFGLFGLLNNGILDLENPQGVDAPMEKELKFFAILAVCLGMFVFFSYF